jgi:type IV secretory pathway protease TraF
VIKTISGARRLLLVLRSLSLQMRLGLLGAGLALVFTAGLSHARLALTPSLPRGLYWAFPPRSPRPGDIVSFCPPEPVSRVLLEHHLVVPGSCPGGSVPLAKRVLAIAPYACAGAAGLALDGRLFHWPLFPPGLALPRASGCGPTPKGCAMVFGDSGDSIDSRVFGCVPASRIRNRLIPILTEPRRP